MGNQPQQNSQFGPRPQIWHWTLLLILLSLTGSATIAFLHLKLNPAGSFVAVSGTSLVAFWLCCLVGYFNALTKRAFGGGFIPTLIRVLALFAFTVVIVVAVDPGFRGVMVMVLFGFFTGGEIFQARIKGSR